MPKQDDISSTERLLNVIRNTDPVKETPVFSSPTSKRTVLSPIHEIFTKSAYCVGVDITDECIRLVKVTTRFNKKPAILDFRSVALSPDTTDDIGRMTDLLRSELSGFCSSSSKQIWTAAPLEETDIRCLRIPKVSAGKLENTVYWTYQKETPFDKNRTILDFRVLGNIIDNGVAKMEVLVSTASRSCVENLKNLFRDAGFELTGVIAPSFAFQNFIKAGWYETGTPLTCSLLIDFNWSRIDIVRPNGDLIVSRGIKAGIASMIESIKNEVARPPENASPMEAAEEETPVLELPAFDAAEADQVLQILNVDSAGAPSVSGNLLKEDDVFNMVLPALERLVRQVERTLEHVTLRFPDGPITKLLFSGPITAFPRLVDYMSSQLDLSVEIIDPFTSVSPDFKTPESATEQATYIASTGLALSDTYLSPNFLLTHQEATKQSRKSRFRYAIVLCFLVATVAIWSNHLFQKRHIHALETNLYQLNLAAGPEESGRDRDSLLAMAAKTNKINQEWKAYCKKYLPVAVIGEVTTLAPEQIRFIRIDGKTSESADTVVDDDTGPKEVHFKTEIFVDGVVYGPRSSMEATLAQYLLALKRSALFQNVLLKKKASEQLNSREVLRFTLDLEGA